MPLSAFDPLIQRWFADHFARPLSPRCSGWPEIAAGRDTLISAPTGSGKTLAAFFLPRPIGPGGLTGRARPDPGRLVSPLKALSNDIQRNLELPLAQIAALAKQGRVSLMPIRTSVRTGDTPMWERAQMIRRPPHSW